MTSPRQLQLAPAPAGPPSCSPVSHRLSEAPQRCCWRKRKAAEYDEVQLGEKKCARVQLASTGHAEEGSLASIDFVNASSRPVRMLWLNYDGHEVPYTVLQPNESKVYRTYAQHAWQARCLETARRMCINGAQATVAAAGAEQARAVITDPPRLSWHESTHAAFPRPFRHQAAALLLCWQRLTGRGPACSSGGSSMAASRSSGEVAAADLGCLPFELVRHVIEQLAPADLWQEGRAATHPGIPPVQLHSRSGFKQLVQASRAASGQQLPPRSRLSVAEVTPRQTAPQRAQEEWPRSPLAALNRMMTGLLGPFGRAQ